MIGGIAYINLAHRSDRKTHILSELKKLEPLTTTIHRIDAVLEPLCGHLGCGKSHVKALELAIEKKWSSVLIVEDDLQFMESSDILIAKLEDVSNCPWDVLMLGLGHHYIRPSEYPHLSKVVSCTCAHGYIVKREYYTTLLENFKGAVAKMEQEIIIHRDKCIERNEPVTKLNYCSAIDQSWFSLQARDNFLVFVPELGKQKYELYSDNNCSMEHQQYKIAAAASI
jgi:GR25 family glycosyltransferase involved in LPS biosynthesis